MKKRKINKEYLHSITSIDIRKSTVDAGELISTLERFAHGYLSGLMQVEVTGTARGEVTLHTPAFSYLIRLICEEATDEPATCAVTLSDKLVMHIGYPAIQNDELTAYLVQVARLVGFKVEREGDVLIFSTDIRITSIMHVYATSSDELMDLLIRTYNM